MPNTRLEPTSFSRAMGQLVDALYLRAHRHLCLANPSVWNVSRLTSVDFGADDTVEADEDFEEEIFPAMRTLRIAFPNDVAVFWSPAVMDGLSGTPGILVALREIEHLTGVAEVAVNDDVPYCDCTPGTRHRLDSQPVVCAHGSSCPTHYLMVSDFGPTLATKNWQ